MVYLPVRPKLSLLNPNHLQGTAPVFSYRVLLWFTDPAAGTLFQSRVTTKLSLTNMVYYVYPFCGSR